MSILIPQSQNLREASGNFYESNLAAAEEELIPEDLSDIILPPALELKLKLPLSFFPLCAVGGQGTAGLGQRQHRPGLPVGHQGGAAVR